MFDGGRSGQQLEGDEQVAQNETSVVEKSAGGGDGWDES